MILGLDISTSITGYTLLTRKGKVVEIGHIDLRKERNFFAKAAIVEDKLNSITSFAEIDAVYIEQSLHTFRSGRSSAQTLSLLSKFNGVVSWLCYNLFGLEPEYLAATSARKLCGIKVPKGRKGKEVVFEFVVDTEPAFSVEYTKFGNPRPGYGDRADSYIIAKAGLVNEHKKTQDPN